jgi:hypothetical protein
MLKEMNRRIIGTDGTVEAKFFPLDGGLRMPWTILARL